MYEVNEAPGHDDSPGGEPESEPLLPRVRNESSAKKDGMSVPTTAVMVAGTIAGSGVLALPSAVEATGLIGPILIVYFAVISGYTGAVLGWCWDIVESRDSSLHRAHTQDPYPLIGERAFGRPGRTVVKASIYVAIYGAGVVFLLLASDIITDLIKTLGNKNFSICYVALIVGAVLAPLNWFGTPRDFWPMGVAALASTGGACALVTGYTIYLRYEKHTEVTHPDVELEKFFLALGTMQFSLAGHPAFPSIQQDMKDRNKFGTAIILGFLMVVCLYLTICISSYLLLGDLVGPNILTTLASLEPAWPVTASEFLILIHLITAYLVVLNPVSQDLEEIFKIPNKFCVKRVLLRTSLICLIIFTAETIPRFAVLLALIGGSAITMIVLILPVTMYEALCRADGPWPKIEVPLYLSVLHVEILLIGIMVIGTSTYSAIKDIVAPDSFVPPCYVNITAAHI